MSVIAARAARASLMAARDRAAEPYVRLMREQRMPVDDIALVLDALKVGTERGAKWTGWQVHKMLKRLGLPTRLPRPEKAT